MFAGASRLFVMSGSVETGASSLPLIPTTPSAPKAPNCRTSLRDVMTSPQSLCCSIVLFDGVVLTV
jgi:hypothetical protein